MGGERRQLTGDCFTPRERTLSFAMTKVAWERTLR